MEVYKSQYMHLAFFAELELIEMTWFPSTDNMTEEEYKQELLNYLDLVLKFRPNKVIGDTRNLFFAIVPELQEWINQTIFPPILEVGVKKVAFIMSQEIVAQLSIEQTMEEQEGLKFISAYFDNKESAKDWVLSTQ